MKPVKVYVKTVASGSIHQVYLSSLDGIQRFQVGPDRDDAEEAEWYADQLRKCLGVTDDRK